MSKFSIYLIGFVIFVAGVSLGANLLGVPPRWIAVMVLVLIGVGIFAGVTNTKRDDPPTA
jgi:hypothetical protein